MNERRLTRTASPSVIMTPPGELRPLLPSLPEGLRPYAQETLEAPATPPLPNEGSPPIADESGFEARTLQYSWPWAVDLTGGLGPVVYTTRRRWNACDVYVSVNMRGAGGAPFEKGVLSILIYAVSASGKRTLVSSGRAQDGAVLAGVAEPLWIAAARGSAQRWEVVLAMYQKPGSAAADVDLTVTVVASDDTTPPPPLLGAIPVGGGAASSTGQVVAASVLMGNAATQISIPCPELCGLVWVNGSAGAARYLMYFEGQTPAITNAPFMTWPLGAAAGDGIFDWLVRRRTSAHIQAKAGYPPGYFALAVSSTPHLYTPLGVDDCWGQTFVR